MKFIVHTDGSNVHNGFPHSYGGYGYVIQFQDNDGNIQPMHITGGGSMPVNEKQPVTNNKAELSGPIAVLEYLVSSTNFGCLTDCDEIEIVSDSQYFIKCGTGEWKLKKNFDLWTQFFKLKKILSDEGIRVKLTWIKGHVGHEFNELADQLAGEYCAKAKPTS